MKKLALTIAIVLGLSMTTFANPDGGGLFQRGEVSPETSAIYGNRDNSSGLLLPGHNLSENQDADDPTPLGSGIAVLMSLGAAYLVGKKRREE